MRQKTAVINVKVNATTKAKAAQLSAKLGMSLSLVVQGSLQQFIEQGGISFYAIDPELKPNARTARQLREAQREPIDVKKVFDSAAKFNAYLDTLTKKKRR